MRQQQLFEYGPFVTADINYVNFARGSSNYDNLQAQGDNLVATVGDQGEIVRDGIFNPGDDLFRTGQRLDARPSLSYPFQLWRKFDVLPAVHYRETQYQFNPPGGQQNFPASAARRLRADRRARQNRIHPSVWPRSNLTVEARDRTRGRLLARAVDAQTQ